jgi:hypothetical protein
VVVAAASTFFLPAVAVAAAAAVQAAALVPALTGAGPPVTLERSLCPSTQAILHCVSRSCLLLLVLR